MENKIVIGVDASRSNIKQKTGTEYYSSEIISQILKNPKYIFRLYSKTPLDFIENGPNIEQKVMHFPRLWSQVRLSYEIWRNRPDVLFEPAHTIPLYHGEKTVVTIHDIGFRYFPELYTPLERYYHHFCMKFSAKHSTKIIAISENTKKDIVKFYKTNPDKISVIYHGYDHDKYFPKNSVTETEKKYGKYIYFIGRLEAKKNIVNLIKAYGLLRSNPDVSHKLLLAGRPGYQYENIAAEIMKLPPEIRQDVIQPGYVPDQTVSELMQSADIFAFPSYFEGFGLPLVEAMACGVPVVASNTTCIPEIMGDAAVLCDPNDYKKIADNLYQIINDKGLRQQLITKGLERVKNFDWTKSAEQTLDVIESALRSN